MLLREHHRFPLRLLAALLRLRRRRRQHARLRRRLHGAARHARPDSTRWGGAFDILRARLRRDLDSDRVLRQSTARNGQG
jgi:hypothetical protein